MTKKWRKWQANNNGTPMNSIAQGDFHLTLWPAIALLKNRGITFSTGFALLRTRSAIPTLRVKCIKSLCAYKQLSAGSRRVVMKVCNNMKIMCAIPQR